MVKPFAALCMAAMASLQVSPVFGAPIAPRAPAIANDGNGRTVFGLPDGSHVNLGADGMGERTYANGRRSQPMMIVRPQYRTAVEAHPGPSDIAVAQRIATARPGAFKSGEVLVVFRSGVNAAGIAGALAQHRRLSVSGIGDARLSRTLEQVGAQRAQPLFAKSALPVPTLAQAYRVHITASSPIEAARRLRSLPSVAYASPDFYAGSFATDPVPMPASEQRRASQLQFALRAHRTLTQSLSAAPLPSNYGLQSSLQSFLNANSVNVVGAYEDIMGRFGQLPGAGERITNVSIGDLTDQAMADAGDSYVQFYGPTSIVSGGQRYLDIPSMGLIPTFTADQNATLNPTGSTEFQDPFLGEILLDFSVMAPLPHDRQRSSALGSGDTDLLGIAPGAQYRLVVPATPTFSNIDSALLAAATQVPRPDVITASLGFGTDAFGFPGRYLEDDPITQAIVSAIVQQYGIVVCISSNDGTRLYTNEGVNPDGGSTPTDLVQSGGYPTSIGDDAFSTTPTKVFDSGAIAVGGSTLDDVFVAPPLGGGALAGQNAFAETRLDGALDFSSGFGSRVNVAAPSDNIPSMVHICTSSPCTAQSVLPVLEGGTSASAPETAAAAAVLLQAARLSGKHLTPANVREILASTGRVLPNAPQIDRPLTVGPQVDLTAAVESVLGKTGGKPAIARVAVAQRQNIGNTGGSFFEATDPANIDLTGPVVGTYFPIRTGQNAVSPITIAPDWRSVPSDASYALRVGNNVLATTRTARLMPSQILSAAGLPLEAPSARTVTLSYRATRGRSVLTEQSFTLTFGQSDGLYDESLAPLTPPTIKLGNAVTVRYDVSHVKSQDNGIAILQNPQIIVSAIGHWNAINAPYFRIAYSAPITAPKGSITIPASVFASGAGIYGVGILQNPNLRLVGEFAPIRVQPDSTERPAAPTLSSSDDSAQQLHTLTVTRANPKFDVHFDVSHVRGAYGAVLEISAPGPTLGNLLNVFNNAFGSRRDANGVDSGSVVYRPLVGTQGTVALDAVALNLPSSLQYNVRVLPTGANGVTGEASPVSTLQFVDGITPGGAYVSSFDISPGGTSVVGTISLDGNGQVSGSGIFPYQTATGTYSSPFVNTFGQDQYYVFGSDPTLNQSAAIDFGPFLNGYAPSSQKVMTFDNTTGQIVANASIDPASNEIVAAAIVDKSRHRMAILADDFAGKTSDVFTYSLPAGTLGAPIVVTPGPMGRQYNTFDIDQSTGMLYLTSFGGGDNCYIFHADAQSLNIDTGAHAISDRTPGCATNITSDQAGGNAYLTVGALSTIGRLPSFRSFMLPLNDQTLVEGNVAQLEDRGAYLSGVDPVHHLLLEGFVASNDLWTNNNAMSSVDVIDMRTGATLKHLPTFGFLYPLATNIPFSQRGIQVDPKTRTAWTYGPYGNTVQQFTY